MLYVTYLNKNEFFKCVTQIIILLESAVLETLYILKYLLV